MNSEKIQFHTRIVAVKDTVVASVREMTPIARNTLKSFGSHIPTAILHTFSGLFTMVLPFETDKQKRFYVDCVKREALKRDAFAVTTITNTSITDCRTGFAEEALVLATSIQGGQPYVVIQKYTRDESGQIKNFGEILEGDDAFIIGQMLIFPDWGMERAH